MNRNFLSVDRKYVYSTENGPDMCKNAPDSDCLDEMIKLKDDKAREDFKVDSSYGDTETVPDTEEDDCFGSDHLPDIESESLRVNQSDLKAPVSSKRIILKAAVKLDESNVTKGITDSSNASSGHKRKYFVVQEGTNNKYRGIGDNINLCINRGMGSTNVKKHFLRVNKNGNDIKTIILLKKGSKERSAKISIPSSVPINESRLKQNVIKVITNDEVSFCARNDPTIVKIGVNMYNKNGKDMPHFISQTMRELACLLIVARKENKDIKCLSDIIEPGMVEVAMEATKRLCSFDHYTNRFSNPSFALRIGQQLKECARIKMSECLLNKSPGLEDAENFLTFIGSEWTNFIFSKAPTDNKMNKGQMLPLADNVHVQSKQPSPAIPFTNLASKASPNPTEDVYDIDDENIDSVCEGQSLCEKSTSTDLARNTKLKQKTRRYDKKLACFFCDKLFTQGITEHWYITHNKKPEVAKILAATGDKKQEMILRLRNLGNFRHNIRVLQKGGDDVIPVRRTLEKTEFLPCISCYGFYKSQELYLHVKSCPFRCKAVVNMKHTSVKAGARLMLNSAVAPDSLLAEDEVLLNTLKTRSGEIRNQVVGDKLLIRFGHMLLNILGFRRKNDVTERVRHLARLKAEVNNTKRNGSQLMNILCGKRFDDVMNAVKKLAGFHENEESVRCKNPALALKLGYTLEKAAEIKIGLCLRNDDIFGFQEGETFINLYHSEWKDTVSSIALANLKIYNFNKGEVLTLTDDLKVLKEYLCKRMLVLMEQMSSPSCESWQELAEVTLARLLLFNKRRGTEASKLLLFAYVSRPDWNQTDNNEEILECLTPLERNMFNRIDIVQSKQDMNKMVPTLFTVDMVRAVDILIQHRRVCNIRVTNKYVFANQEDGHLRSLKVLNDVAHKAGCKKPHLINSISMSKYIATVFQMLDLNEGEVQWLSSQLAYTVKTHNGQLQETAEEIRKVSKLVLAAENGTHGQLHLEDDDICDPPDDPINDPLDDILVDSVKSLGSSSRSGESSVDEELNDSSPVSTKSTTTELRIPVPAEVKTTEKMLSDEMNIEQSPLISSSSLRKRKGTSTEQRIPVPVVVLERITSDDRDLQQSPLISSSSLRKRKAAGSSLSRTKISSLAVSYKQSDDEIDDSDGDPDYKPSASETNTEEEELPRVETKKISRRKGNRERKLRKVNRR